MPSALGFVGGGLLSGIGEGLVETGEAKRERALKAIEQKDRLKRDEKQMEGKAKFERVMADLEHKRTLERDAKQLEGRGLLLGERLDREDARQTTSDARTLSRLNLQLDNKADVARIAAGKSKDTTAAEDRIIGRHVEVDENGIETVNHEAAAVELEERGFNKAAAAQRRKAKGIVDLDIRKKAEQFADQMVEEQSEFFSSDVV